jgi:hypothetical protein
MNPIRPSVLSVPLTAACVLVLGQLAPTGDAGAPAPPAAAPLASAAGGWPLSASGPVDWSGTTLAAELLAPVGPFLPPPRDPCGQVAFIARTAAFEQARADYLFAVGKCVNAHGSFARCLRELHDGYREAIQLAREQYEARLEACDLLDESAYRPRIEPREFRADVDNRFLPFVPGRTLVYRKTTREGVEETRVTTRRETVEINGVTCRVVRDVVRLDGELIEDTDDWFAQHRGGAVWYFGEIARNYEDGMLADLDGSWRYGRDGALPGIVMLAEPRRGNAYRQEFMLNAAEDLAEVVGRGVTVTVPYGTFHDCLETEDTTPLEPDANEHKFYAPGVGLVLEVDGEGGRNELVAIVDG